VTGPDQLILVWLREPDGGQRCAFVLDGLDYPDAEALQAERLEALTTLDRLRIPAEFETQYGGGRGHVAALPSWREWRREHVPDAE
jgi:hypothetical protein